MVTADGLTGDGELTKIDPVFSNEEDMTFERLFFETALERAKKKKLSKRAIAKMLFWEHSNPERAMQALQGKTSSGKPQRLTLAEAYRLANIIGEDFAKYCTMIEYKMAGEESTRF